MLGLWTSVEGCAPKEMHGKLTCRSYRVPKVASWQRRPLGGERAADIQSRCPPSMSPKQVVSDSSSRIEPMRCSARRNINVTHHIADKMTLSYLLPVFRKSFEKRVGRRKTSVDHHLDTGTCMPFGARHPKDFRMPSIAHPTAW